MSGGCGCFRKGRVSSHFRNTHTHTLTCSSGGVRAWVSSALQVTTVRSATRSLSCLEGRSWFEYCVGGEDGLVGWGWLSLLKEAHRALLPSSSVSPYRVELGVPLGHPPPFQAQDRLDEEQVRDGVAHRLLTLSSSWCGLVMYEGSCVKGEG